MPNTGQFIAAHEAEIAKVMSVAAAEATLNSLVKNYYPGKPDALLDESMLGDVLANLVRRQSAFERFLTPWVSVRRPLAGATVIDIGCGTGSSTAAFARVAKQVRGYEIAAGPVAVAADRLSAMGLTNASVQRVEPDETLRRLRDEFPNGVEVIALIAVLEHMTEQERIDFLPAVWDYMRPGDVLVVAELPNRLTYNDDHTSQMPFFHMLPLEIKKRYANRSKRADFVASVNQLSKGPRDTLELALCRWGIGLSFHDFEIGFGVEKLETITLADGYEHSTVDWWPITKEERVLLDYFVSKPVAKPLGFCRSVLNFIFVKPQRGAPVVMLKHDQNHLQQLGKASAFAPMIIERLLSPGTVGNND